MSTTPMLTTPMITTPMITTRRWLLPLALLTALSACSRDHHADEGTSRTSASDAASASGDTVSAPVATNTAPAATDAWPAPATGSEGGTAATDSMASDADLLGVLAAIDQHEIDAANQARQHKLDAAVGKFADMMIRDHTANLEQTRALGANGQNPEAVAEAEAGRQHLQQLGDTPDTQYQKAYVDAMVEGHTKALATLDQTLIPGAKDARAKDHLRKTRDKVAQHLEQAKALQK